MQRAAYFKELLTRSGLTWIPGPNFHAVHGVLIARILEWFAAMKFKDTYFLKAMTYLDSALKSRDII